MLKRLKNRADEEAGFTLIELMVVVLIIGILIAIALPTFLGARERAQNRAAQSSLRNALVAAKTAYTDDGDYLGADTAAELDLIEPSLSYLGAAVPSTGPTAVSVAVNAGGNLWSGAALSDSGDCFWIADDANGPGTTYDVGGACTGTGAQGAAGTTW